MSAATGTAPVAPAAAPAAAKSAGTSSLLRKPMPAFKADAVVDGDFKTVSAACVGCARRSGGCGASGHRAVTHRDGGRVCVRGALQRSKRAATGAHSAARMGAEHALVLRVPSPASGCLVVAVTRGWSKQPALRTPRHQLAAPWRPLSPVPAGSATLLDVCAAWWAGAASVAAAAAAGSGVAFASNFAAASGHQCPWAPQHMPTLLAAALQ